MLHGAPMDAPLFVAIDADVPAAEFPAVAGYGRDVNLATNSPVRPYGKYALVEELVTPGPQPMHLSWQTAAWSGDQVSGKADLYQRCTPHHPVAGLSDGDYDGEGLPPSAPPPVPGR